MKAAPTKIMLFFLAEIVQQRVPDERDLHICLWGATQFLHLMDMNGWMLSREAAADMCHAGEANQITYLKLAKRAAANGEHMYDMPPKFHAHSHVIDDIRNTRLNPKYFHCFGDEDFVGRIGRLSAQCHPTTQSHETLIRYLAGLRQKWT